MSTPACRSILPVLVLGLAPSCASRDETRASESQPIVNGTPTTESPATVFLDMGGGGCSGTLISRRVVLTAAHCLQGMTPADVNVFFGSEAGGEGTRIEVVHVAVHPSTDLGILTMKADGPTEPVPPMASDLARHIGEPVHMVGFGVTAETGDDFGIKREGMTSLDAVDGDLMLTSTTTAGTCYGDSGGPLYMTIRDIEYVAGVTSTGTSECGMGQDVSVRTDVYLEWIADYVATYESGVCASDGTCDPLCPDYLDGDVDCAGCENGAGCRTDCPDIDRDCCPEDGTCNEDCGTIDLDCAAVSAPDAGTDASADGEGGGCAVGGPDDRGVWLLVLVGLAMVVRRRRG